MVGFLMMWFVGVIATGRLIYSSETLFRGWVDGMHVFKAVCLFKYESMEEEDDAVFYSVVCLWLPVAALGAWWFNRWLKRLV